MKKLLSIFLTAALLLAAVTAYAHEEPPPDIDSTAIRHAELLAQAYDYLFGANEQVIDYQAAIDIYLGLIAENNAHAFYMLGNMYLAGKGFVQNDTAAMLYFKAATQRGSGRAALRIAAMKRNNEDWTTYEEWQANALEVIRWANKAANLGYQRGYYALGMAYYQGYGLEQNYQRAVEYFDYLTKEQNPFGAYMLGFCYLNGYGVERDAEAGQELIERAESQRLKLAGHFVSTVSDFNSFRQGLIDMEGNPKQPLILSGAIENSTPTEFHSYPNNVLKNKIQFNNSCADTVFTISGYWCGKLITYDWSGQNIIHEEVLCLDIYEIAGELYGYWIDEHNNVELYATLKDSVWVFGPAPDNLLYYGARSAALKFATFNYACNEEGEILTGNLRRYLPESKDFMPPAIIVLEKATDNFMIINEEKGKLTIADILDSQSVLVYPNPVSDMLTVSFSLSQPMPLTIAVYSYMGNLVYSKTGSYIQGQNVESFWLTAQPGIYNLRIVGSGVNYTTQILKN